MTYVKGQIANPYGRAGKPGNRDRATTQREKSRHKREMRAYLQKKFGEAGKDIADAFAEIAFDKKAGVRERLAALQELANRGWGRPSALQIDVAEPAPLFTLDESPSLKVN